MIRRRSLLAAPLVMVTPPALAETWPNRPIRVVVPFPPGGGTDIAGRLISAKLAEILRQTIVIDNRGGAGGMIGTRAVGQSAPDGYTLLFNGTASIVRDGFDPRSAVDHIARAAITHNILVVNQHVPVSNVNEFINYLRARPGHLNHGTAGPLTSQHLAAVMFDLMAETKMENVHYRGTGPSVAGILSNEVQVMFGSMSAVLPLVNEGKLKALATASERRSIQMPTLPRVADFIPGYGAELTYSYCTPIGTPQSILRKLENAVGEAVRDPALINSLQTRGFEPAFESGESLTRAIDQDMQRWADVLKKAGIDLNQA